MHVCVKSVMRSESLNFSPVSLNLKINCIIAVETDTQVTDLLQIDCLLKQSLNHSLKYLLYWWAVAAYVSWAFSNT